MSGVEGVYGCKELQGSGDYTVVLWGYRAR